MDTGIKSGLTESEVNVVADFLEHRAMVNVRKMGDILCAIKKLADYENHMENSAIFGLSMIGLDFYDDLHNEIDLVREKLRKAIPLGESAI